MLPVLQTILLLLPVCLLAHPAGAQTSHTDLRRTGRYEEAYRDLLRTIQDPEVPLTTELREAQADLLFLLGRVDEAIEAREALAQRRPFPSALLRLADLYEYRGRLDDYAIALRRAASQARVLSGYGVSPEEWVAIGRVYEREGTDARAVLTHLQRLLDQSPANVDGLLAVADLSARKRTWDLAATNYGRVLEVDRTHQEAWAGLAEAYHASGDGRAGAAIDTLLSLNANHPRALLLRARRSLDLGDTKRADADLDRVLASNPTHRTAVALRVAARFLDDDTTHAARLRAEALDFNPHDSGVDRIPGLIASRHYRFEEGVAFQRQALETDDHDLEARFALALDLLRLGRDAEARAHLERVFDADPYHVQAYNLLEVADVIRTFTVLEDSALSVQLPELEERVIGPDLRGMMAEAIGHFESRYRVTLARPVTLQVFENHDEFMVRSVGLPGNAGHLGICFGRLITMDSPRARPAGASNWQRVLWHEFVHVVTLQKTGNRMPRWLSEGVSVYEEALRNPAWGQPLEAGFRPFVVDADLPGLADLERLFTQARSSAELLFGYFASGEFVTYYVDAHGFEALLDALNAVAGGTPADEALLEAARLDRDRLDAGFRRHLAGRTEPLRQLPEPDSDAPHASPYVDAMRLGDSAAADGDVATAEAAYRKAHRLYPNHSGPDGPLRRLAALYAERDTSRYIAILREIVHADATAHAEARKLAEIRAEQGDWSAAVDALDRAYAVTPFDPTLLRDRVRAHRERGDLAAAEADLRRLLAADAPRAPSHRLALAHVLRDRNDLSAARAEVLGLLESVPYDWEAQQFLLELVDAQGEAQ